MTLMNAPGRLLVGPVVLLVSFSSSYDGEPLQEIAVTSAVLQGTVSDIDVNIYSG